MDKILIVDGNSLANRAFYAMPYLSDKKGRPSGAIFGFVNILVKLITEQKPTHIIVAFDHSRQTFRSEIYPEYKATRHAMPDDLRAQMPVIKEMLSIMEIKTFEVDGIEADDIIGTISRKTNINKILLTGDRDLLQLINDNTHVWLTKKGVTEVKKMDEGELFNEYGLEPYQIIELKALMGDTSDNIPGIKGVGEKTALSLLNKYSNIDNLYKNIEEITGKLKEKIEQGKDMAYLSKKLATIKTDCEFDFRLEECILKFPFNIATYDFCNERSFYSVVKRKELFKENIDLINEKNKRERVLIDDINKIEELKKNISKYFSYNFEEFEFCGDTGSVYYLNKTLDIFSTNIDLSDCLIKLKEVFENDKIIKITKSAKSDLKELSKYEINLNNFFDLTLSSYVLRAGFSSIENDFLTENYVKEMFKLKEEMEQKEVDFVYNEIEYPLVNVLHKMEQNGFKIDKEILNDLSEKFEDELNILEDEICDAADEKFNVNSPKQVAHILYDKLQLKSNRKQSTDFNHLIELINEHVIVGKIIKYRKLAKLKNTYIDVYKDLTKRNGDIIHTIFNQSNVSTGRLSSSEPNLQNIPTRDEEGKNLRKLFISKFENGSIISADYNQIELRLLADMSMEENLINAYNNGDDIHALTASQIFNKDISEISSNERRDAKVVNFGIIYGISEYGLSQNIKSTVKSAKEYINSYFERYPKVKEFMDNNIKFAKENGYIRTKFGRIRNIPEISSSVYNTRTFGERVAMNSSLQGTASDIIKLAMIKIDKRLENMKSQLILQIHDELIVDVYPNEEEKVCEILQEEMENIAKFAIPIPVSLGKGKNLYDCK